MESRARDSVGAAFTLDGMDDAATISEGIKGHAIKMIAG
jgi:hypothetical protein